MNQVDIIEVYKDLGISIQPLPDNYNPDTYGKRLMYSSDSRRGVSYAAQTHMLSNKDDSNDE